MRLSLDKYPPLFPHVGEIETSSLSADGLHETSVILDGPSAQVGGKARLGYRVDHTVAAITRSDQFIRKAEALFAPKPGSLADRLSQGMIWMTRGRRSMDRAERLLFFFTAIEAMLTKGHGDPISETIARYSSAILNATPSHRLKTFKRVKGLYGVRSQVVHGGSHNVSDADANGVQLLAEALYEQVLALVPLSSSQEDFFLGLDRATHGTAWPGT